MKSTPKNIMKTSIAQNVIKRLSVFEINFTPGTFKSRPIYIPTRSDTNPPTIRHAIRKKKKYSIPIVKLIMDKTITKTRGGKYCFSRNSLNVIFLVLDILLDNFALPF